MIFVMLERQAVEELEQNFGQINGYYSQLKCLKINFSHFGVKNDVKLGLNI